MVFGFSERRQKQVALSAVVIQFCEKNNIADVDAWMQSSQTLFGGESPNSILATGDDGLQRVLTTLYYSLHP